MRGADMRGGDMRGGDMRRPAMRRHHPLHRPALRERSALPQAGPGDLRQRHRRRRQRPHRLRRSGVRRTIRSARRPTWRRPATTATAASTATSPAATRCRRACTRPARPRSSTARVAPHDYDQTRTFDTRSATAEYAHLRVRPAAPRASASSPSTAPPTCGSTSRSRRLGARRLDRARRLRPGVRRQSGDLPEGRPGRDVHRRRFSALPAGTYYIIVQSFPGTQGATTLRLSTGHGSEICDNGVDDDGNGLVDCADQACVNAPNCVDQECKPELNLGAIIVDAPAKTADFDTAHDVEPLSPDLRRLVDRQRRTSFASRCTRPREFLCNGRKVTAPITSSPSSARRPPGRRCDASQMSCYYPGGALGRHGRVLAAAGRRLPASSSRRSSRAPKGRCTSRVSAFKNRQQEICNNGIDDDGNGLIDCDDPACYGVGSCKPPICTPDVEPGRLHVGYTEVDQRSTSPAAPTTTPPSCAKGGGKSKVVRVNLTQPMGLGYSCDETGSQVLAADAAHRAARRLRRQPGQLRRSVGAAVRLQLRHAQPAAGHLRRARRSVRLPATKAAST